MDFGITLLAKRNGLLVAEIVTIHGTKKCQSVKLVVLYAHAVVVKTNGALVSLKQLIMQFNKPLAK